LLPSSQVVALDALLYLQPTVGSQLSAVHTLPSSQLRLPAPTQAPCPLHMSPVVHTLPSLQLSVFGLLVNTQPVAALHVSVVQSLPSLQLIGAAPTHCPSPSHASIVVQASSSLQGAPTASGA
jgi:hypothetical protein